MQSIPCADLDRRLAAIYALAIRRAKSLVIEENGVTMMENANDAIGSNNDAVLTSNADCASERANA